MTVAVKTPTISYTENGVTLLFAVPFRYLAADHLVVTRVLGGVTSVLVYGIAWTATAGLTDAGGTVTLAASVAGASLKIERVTPREQQDDYVTNNNFAAETLEAALDRQMLVAQEQDRDAAALGGRAVLAAPGEAGLVLGKAASLVGTPKVVGTDPATGALVLRDPAPKGDKGAPGDPLAGVVTPETFGAIGNNVANDLPAWLAMYTYAKANGIKKCQCAPGEIYAWWAPTVTVANTNDAFDVLGPVSFMTVSHDFTLDGQGARINLKAYNGGNLQSVTQAISGNAAWRGNGFNVIGGTAGTSSFGIKRVAIRDLRLNGGWTRVTGASAAAELAQADFLSNKGFRIQDTGIEEILCENVDISGFGGEVWYFGNLDNTTQITLINCRGSNSNQAALNPSRGNFTDIGGQYGNAPIAIEALGGTGQRYIGTRFYNSWLNSFYGAAQFNGGGAVSYAQPTNTGAEGEPPFIDFDDVVFDNCGTIAAANYLRGKITLLDTSLTLEAGTAGECHDIYLEIECVTHKKNNGSFLVLGGPNNTTTAYGAGFVKLPRNINIKITERRTQYAIANSIQTAALVDVQGLLDPASVVVDVGVCETGVIANSTSGLAMPFIRAGAPMNGGTVITTTAGGTAYSLAIKTPLVFLVNSGVTGIVTVALSVPFAAPGGYGFNQRCRIGYSGSSTAGTVYLFRKNGANMQLNADRRLVVRGDYLELEYDYYTTLWNEVGFFSQTPDRCTVAQLPAAAAIYNGNRMFVTDANATLTAGIGAVVVGGGANAVPVICDGAAWRIG